MNRILIGLFLSSCEISCINSDHPFSFSYPRRYYSIFNFDLESNLLLEIDEDTGKLKGNWPFSEINMRLAIEKGRG